MKPYSWIPWLLAIFFCFSPSEARYKLRRPLPVAPPPPLPPPQILKKAWPISHRMSVPNTIHLNNNYMHKRPVFIKPNNMRIRRPPMVFNAPPTNWKSPMPLMAAIPNLPVLPQRAPLKEFNVLNKAFEYSPEYKPEPVVASPPTHRSGIDDDKGPIHTIPAPNLSIADKPFTSIDNNREDNRQDDYRRYPTDSEYNANNQVTNEPQRPVTSPAPSQPSYEVTESTDVRVRDYQTSPPSYLAPEFESSRVVSSAPNADVQSNEVYLNHPSVSRSGIVGTNIQFGQSNVPMQTNLHSSLHVGFPGTAAQAPTLNSQIPELHVGQQTPDIHVGQQIPDLHVGHPAIAGPPMSATQLYELLNSFPQPLGDQYSTGQQPQLQQHILQQQLGQLFQPEANPTTFSQPQMHSFNYDEQANKQHQQQILIGQDYGLGRVTADYNLQPEQHPDIQNTEAVNKQQEDYGYQPESVEQPENNIEFDEAAYGQQADSSNQNNYFSDVNNDDSISSQFYTTLPNREAAEKLAALAAAGSVNSKLIQQLQKQQREREQQQFQLQQEQQDQQEHQQEEQQDHHQQQQQQYEDDSEQNDEPVPNNHKGNYQVSEEVDDVPNQSQEHYRQRQRLRFSAQKRYRQHQRQQQIQREQEQVDKHYERQGLLSQEPEQHQHQQQQNNDGERPLRIMVPDVQENPSSQNSDDTSNDYDYENDEPENTNTKSADSEENYENISSDFGSRIRSKSRK